MAKIHAPNKDYTGISATVKFEKGVGETDDEVLITWFEEHGYKVEDSPKAAKPKTEKAGTNQTGAETGKTKGKKAKPETEKQPEGNQTAEGENDQTGETDSEANNTENK